MLCQIYRNLHKKGVVYSVRSVKTKRVVTYLSEFVMSNAVFKVSQSGRERVLKEKRKNVHAYIQGELLCGVKPRNVGKLVTYNPYRFSNFVLVDDTTKELKSAKSVNVSGQSIRATGVKLLM